MSTFIKLCIQEYADKASLWLFDIWLYDTRNKWRHVITGNSKLHIRNWNQALYKCTYIGWVHSLPTFISWV